MVYTFSEDDLNRGKIVKPGWYPVEIKEVTQKAAGPEAKNPGSRLDLVELTILDGEEKGVILYSQFSEVAPGFVAPFQAALTGKPIKAGDKMISFDDSAALKGKKLDVHVSRDKYKGKDKNVVDDYAPFGARTKRGVTANA